MKKKISLKKSLSKITKPFMTKGAFAIKVPRFKDMPLNIYLVFVIVIFAFFLGMLTNKVFYLQTQVNSMSKANTAPTQGGTAALQAPLPSAPAGPVNVSVGNYPVLGDANAK